MEILDILKEKQKIIKSKESPLEVQFNLEEIELLSDLTALRALKLSVNFPTQFKISTDIFECHKRIVDGDNIYRTLEFCLLKNRVLMASVTTVFPKLKEGK